MNRVTLPEIRHIKDDVYNLFPVYGKKYTITHRKTKNDNVLESKKIVTAIYLGNEKGKFKFYRINKDDNVEQYSCDINERVFWYFDESTPKAKVEYPIIWTNKHRITLREPQKKIIKEILRKKLEEIIIYNSINPQELLLL